MREATSERVRKVKSERVKSREREREDIPHTGREYSHARENNGLSMGK